MNTSQVTLPGGGVIHEQAGLYLGEGTDAGQTTVTVSSLSLFSKAKDALLVATCLDEIEVPPAAALCVADRVLNVVDAKLQSMAISWVVTKIGHYVGLNSCEESLAETVLSIALNANPEAIKTIAGKLKAFATDSKSFLKTLSSDCYGTATSNSGPSSSTGSTTSSSSPSGSTAPPASSSSTSPAPTQPAPPASSSSTSPAPTQPAQPAQQLPQPQPQQPSSRGFHVEDDYFGGTWARTDPDSGTWYSRSNRPANGRYFFSNGLGVGVDCARSAAAYVVRYADGHRQTWTWWLHVTDNTWIPAAATTEIYTDGPNGLPGC